MEYIFWPVLGEEEGLEGEERVRKKLWSEALAVAWSSKCSPAEEPCLGS